MDDVKLGQQAPPPEGYSLAHFDRLIHHMDGRLQEMLRTDDPNAVFQLTYVTFSRQVQKALVAGRFEDPAWAADMCCRFVEVYLRQVALWEAQEPAQCRAWRMAFEATDNGSAHVLQAMLLGMNAHIHYDLAFVTLGACRAAGDLSTSANAGAALGAARAGLPTKRYRDFLLINRVGWESIPVLQEVVLGQFNRFLYWGNKLAGGLTRRVGQRVFIESRDASWCQTTLLVHARNSQERAIVTQMIDAFAASVADVIAAVTYRPDKLLAHTGSWLRRWERLDPALVTGLVQLAMDNPVVAELALRELAFAGADPVPVLESLHNAGETRLCVVFTTQVLRLAPQPRRERLEQHLLSGKDAALDVLEALALSGPLPAGLPRGVPLHAVAARWSYDRALAVRGAELPEAAAFAPLASALAEQVQWADGHLRTLGDVGRIAAAPTLADDQVRARLVAHPNRWVQVCARVGFHSTTFAQEVSAMSSIIERVLFLKETPLFMEVEPSVLVHLAERLEPRQVAPGERLVQVGQRNEGIHIIQTGQVEVTQARDTGAVRITMLGPRDAVGELSVLNDMPATADCTAEGQVETYYVPQALLAQLLHQHPRLALGMIRVLSQRLMTTTQQVQRDAAPAGSAPDGCIQM